MKGGGLSWGFDEYYTNLMDLFLNLLQIFGHAVGLFALLTSHLQLASVF